MSSIISRLACIFVVVLVFLVSACSGPSPTTVPLGQQVSLAPGQSVSIGSESLDIKFVELVNDSRCASGVTCIWQGEVSCRLDITYLDTSYTKIITQPGLTSQPSSTEFNGYILRFNIQPYPTAGTTIKTSDYRLQITVEKKSS
jgi:hypothetical protein